MHNLQLSFKLVTFPIILCIEASNQELHHNDHVLCVGAWCLALNCWLTRMEVLREFLEASTIHGLSYISSTRTLSRVFWTSFVISGLSLAGFSLLRTGIRIHLPRPIKHCPSHMEPRLVTIVQNPLVTSATPATQRWPGRTHQVQLDLLSLLLATS